MTRDRRDGGMATIRIGALALLLWWAFAFSALLLWRTFPISESWFWALLITLIGSGYALPTVVYITGIDMLARRLRFPWSSVAFTAAVGAWLAAGLVALRSHGSPDAAAFAWIFTGASLPGIALFLRRQIKSGLRTHSS